MKRRTKVVLTAALLAMSVSTTAFAGTWQLEEKGWRWQENDGSYPASTWQWLDGNQDGVAECYYFDENGYLLTSATTPDGYRVNADGAWMDGPLVQQKALTPAAALYVKDLGRRLYSSSVEKTSSLNSMQAKASLQMLVGIEGLSMEMGVDMDIKFKDLNTGSMKYFADTTMHFFGQEMKQTLFYTDGYYYMDYLGQKVKFAMDFDKAVDEAKTYQQLSGVNMDTGYLKDFEVTRDENGNYVVTYTADADATTSLMNSIYPQLGTDFSSYNFQLTKMAGSAVINEEGYCLSQDIYLSMDMDMDGDTMNLSMLFDCDYLNPGQPVDFSMPSTAGYTDLSEYY